jgi:hypothetical protein
LLFHRNQCSGSNLLHVRQRLVIVAVTSYDYDPPVFLDRLAIAAIDHLRDFGTALLATSDDREPKSLLDRLSWFFKIE